MAANTHFAVAVHALSVLAFLDDITPSEKIASSINTNPVVVRRLMKGLVEHGLVRSVPGKNGGFALAKAPDAISLDAVLEAVGGGAVFRIHENDENPACTVSCNMKHALGDVLTKVDDAVNRELSKLVLSDIVATVS